MGNQLRAATVAVLLAGSCQALSILHTTHTSILASTSATVVYSTTPTAGSLLVLGLGTPLRGTITPPTGWTQLDVITSGAGNVQLYTFYHVVGVSETNSYVFTSTMSQDQWEFVGYEVSGQASASFVNQHGIVTIPATATTITTPSETPSVLGTLALSFMGANTSGRTLSSVSTGWTNDVSQAATFHPTWGASRNSLTSDTTTAITNTFTINSADSMAAAVVLIAPAISTGIPPVIY